MGTTARKNQVPVDQLTWEFPVLQLTEENIRDRPEEGVYIKDMYLEGAGWDKTNQCLCEPSNMELIVNLPIIHFKPVESKRRARNMYTCPCYMYSVRAGTPHRPSYVLPIELKAGSGDSDHWAKRGA